MSPTLFAQAAHPPAAPFATYVVLAFMAIVMAFFLFCAKNFNRWIKLYMLKTGQARLDLDALIGRSVRSLTPLQPSGLVDFHGQRLDALSADGALPADVLVRIVRVQNGQLVVRLTGDSFSEAADSLSDHHRA